MRRTGFIWALCLAVAAGCEGMIGQGGDPASDDPEHEQGPDGMGGRGAGGAGGRIDNPILRDPPGPFRPLAAGLRRLTVAQYTNSVKALLGSTVGVSEGDLDPDDRTYHFASAQSYRVTPTAGTAAGYQKVAFNVAGQALGNATLRQKVTACDPATAGCIDTFIKTFGRRVFRRPLATDEAAKFRKVVDAGTAAHNGDPWAGLQYGVAGMLQDPNFLYIVLLGEPDPVAPGQRRYTSIERASLLSYALLDGPPDSTLLDAADRGELLTDVGLRLHALRLLGTETAKAAVARFFGEHFGYVDLDDVVKDRAAFPTFTTDLALSMRGELERTLGGLALDPARDLREMFDTRETYLNAALAKVYGVTGPTTASFQPVMLPAVRAGILTMAGVSTLYANNLRTSPTLRGIFIRERLLCQAVPPPPPNVTTDLNMAPATAKTTREKLTAHRNDPACAACHAFMDPIGLALENFDGIGVYRTTENKVAIDVSGELDGTKFNGAVALGQILKSDPHIAPCLIGELFKAAAGQKDPTAIAGAEAVLRQLEDRFVAGGYRFRDLLADLVTSKLFTVVGNPI